MHCGGVVADTYVCFFVASIYYCYTDYWYLPVPFATCTTVRLLLLLSARTIGQAVCLRVTDAHCSAGRGIPRRKQLVSSRSCMVFIGLGAKYLLPYYSLLQSTQGGLYYTTSTCQFSSNEVSAQVNGAIVLSLSNVCCTSATLIR